MNRVHCDYCDEVCEIETGLYRLDLTLSKELKDITEPSLVVVSTEMCGACASQLRNFIKDMSNVGSTLHAEFRRMDEPTPVTRK